MGWQSRIKREKNHQGRNEGGGIRRINCYFVQIKYFKHHQNNLDKKMNGNSALPFMEELYNHKMQFLRS